MSAEPTSSVTIVTPAMAGANGSPKCCASSRAPTMTGGAGDGTPKALQAKPIANASARPRRSFMAVSERGGVPVLQDVAGNNKAERNRHEHERADQAGRCGRGYVEIPATCA